MVQNYLFDLYGTLVDIHTNENKRSLWEKMALFYSMNGAEYKPAELKKRYNELCSLKEKQLAETMVMPRNEVEIRIGQVFETLYMEKGIMVSKDTVRATGIMFRSLSTEKCQLFPGAKELLERLKKDGKNIYLLSNAQRLFTEPEMKMLGIYELFDGILYSSDAGIKKPSAAFFESILEEYSLLKMDTVMVGNDVYTDVFGAQSAGLASMYIETEQSTPYSGKLPAKCKTIKEIGQVY